MTQISEYTYEGAGADRKLVSKMKSILLNGTHIAILVPGDDEPRPKAVNE